MNVVTRFKCRYLLIGSSCLLVLYLFSYLIINDAESSTYFRNLPKGEEDKFMYDHIDVPEIPVPALEKEHSDSNKDGIESEATNKTRLKWHNKPSENVENGDSRQLPVLKSEEIIELEKFSKQEVQRFKEMLKTWPKGRPKAAFYILTKISRLSYLHKLLNSVDTYFNSQFKYPIVIFHEADLTPVFKDIRNFTNSQIFFQFVTFKIPDFITEPVQFHIPCLSAVSYRHMCRFHAKTVYENPVVKELDYYWRLDDDSRLLSPINYDVFVFMRDNRLHYGYSWIFYDSESCVTGLWEATSRYVREHDIKAKFFNEWAKPQLYYNNFEISSTKMWLSEDYKSYIEYLDLLGGMYYTRWGDAPIHGIAVSLFLEKNQTHLFKDIGYKHNSYINKVP